MAFNVTEFRSNMIGDGARANLFEIAMTPKFAGSNVAEKLKFTAKAAQLPGSTLGTTPVFYFGREIKMAGNRTFADWTITVINDEDFVVRNSLERWMNAINSHAGNVRNILPTNDYFTDAEVIQYTKTGQEAKKYRFVGMFPVDVSPIDLDWGTNDSIEEFSVTFAYQWWESNSTDNSAYE